jgi:O-antigen ligase
MHRGLADPAPLPVRMHFKGDHAEPLREAVAMLAVALFVFAHLLPGLSVPWRQELHQLAFWGSGAMATALLLSRKNDLVVLQRVLWQGWPLAALLLLIIFENAVRWLSGHDQRSNWQNGLHNLGGLGVAVLMAALIANGRVRWFLGVSAAMATIAIPASLLYHGLGHVNPKERFVFVDFSFQTLKGASLIGFGGVAALLLALESDASRRLRLWLALLLATCCGMIMLSASRGALLALIYAGVGVLLLGQLDSARRIFLFWVAGFAGIVLLIIFESGLCGQAQGFEGYACRPTLRQGIWLKTLEMLRDAPWLGLGVDFRVPRPDGKGSYGNHNGMLGLASAHGLAALGLFTLVLAVAARQLGRCRNDAVRRLCIIGLGYSLCYFGGNLSNPFGRNEGQHLYFLIPLVLCFAGGSPAPLRLPPPGRSEPISDRSGQTGDDGRQP